MIPTPFEHQTTTTEFYTQHPITFNASDPGTGKTRTVIDFVKDRSSKTLVLAPKSILRASWADDIQKFAPDLKVSIATAKNREAAFKADADVFITNHDGINWLKDHDRYTKQFAGGTLVVDESTAFKHHTAARSKNLKKLRDKFDNAIALTGTPNPNGVLDIWGQMLWLDHGERLGSNYWAFRQAACEPKQVGRSDKAIKWSDKEGIEEIIYDLIADVLIRFKLEEVLDMPETITTSYVTELSHKSWETYCLLRDTALLQSDSGIISALNAGAMLQKLLQCLSGAVYDNEGQVVRVDNERNELILDLVEARPQTLVAFNWKHQRDGLVEEATKRGIPFGVIDGSVPDKTRYEVVQAFQEKRLRVIFAHPQSAGHGLTLTKGTTTIWASPSYNAEHFIQFNRRIYRAGQTQRTETILISARDTREAEVYAALGRKLSAVDLLLDLIKV